MPFQSEATVWPFAKAQLSDQLLIGVLPVFWMAMAAPKALVFWGEIVYSTRQPTAGAEPVMVRAMVVLAVKAPEVPAIVTVAVPAAAVLLAVKVSALLPVVGLVP